MTWPFGGLPLGGVFLGQADGPLLPLARIGGPLLLTAGVWAGGVGLATMAPGISRSIGSLAPSRLNTPHLRSAGRSHPGRARALRACRRCGSRRRPGSRSVTVALVQGGGRRGVTRNRCRRPRSSRRRCAPPAVSPGKGRLPSLVLWPEDVVSLSRAAAGLPAGPRGSPAGPPAPHDARRRGHRAGGPTAFRNEIVVWAPNGRIVDTFEKVHRVPFGEYVPYRSFISHLANLSAVPTDAIPGHGTGLLRTPAGPLGTLVSFEVFYANRSRTSVRAGAELLIVPTNTSSYATAQVPTQEVAADAVQAVETGRDLVQAAPTGYSTVVDQRGEVLQRSVLGRRQVLTATVPLRRGFTPYDHWGDLPVLILAALSLTGRLAVFAPNTRATRSSPSGYRRRGCRRPRTWRGWKGSSSKARRRSKPWARRSPTVRCLKSVTCA